MAPASCNAAAVQKSLRMSSKIALETVRLLALLKKAQNSSPELAVVAREVLSGQWALLVVACAALLLLVLLLSFRNELRRKKSTGRLRRSETYKTEYSCYNYISIDFSLLACQ